MRVGVVIDGNVAAYVAEAAIEWDQARREASRLRALRSSFTCEHESSAEYDERGTCTYNGDPACWQATWQDQHGRDCHPSMDEWCEPCRQRQAAHVEYGKAVAKRQGLMRGLQRRALTAWESMATKREETSR